MKFRPFILLVVAAVALSPCPAADSVSVVARPATSESNPYYVGNRAPLLASPLLKLPVGAVRADGWLLEYLRRQAGGLTGHLGEISVWLQKEDNAWLSKDGKGRYGWEELPYWLKGYGNLAYLLNDPRMIAETKVWIEGALNSQRPAGDFGPDQRFDDDGSRDYWANMIMLFCLQSSYEHTADPRVLKLMTKYFRYQLGVPDEKFLTHYWQKMRGGDNLHSVYWLYNRTGDKFLLDLADKIHRCTADWKMKGDLPNWHNVNIAQGFREPAQRYAQTHDRADLEATYANLAEVRKRYGQVPGGMWGGDENSRPGFTDPRQAVETCGMVEQMLSDELLMRETGDPFWGDHCEEVAFNTYPAATMPDFGALRYLTAPNMALSDDQDHAPGIQNSGPFLMMNPFSSRCCQHNHSHGWPYFTENTWMATPDRGLCAAIYAPTTVRAKVGDGTTVQITEQTQYPFRDAIDFVVEAPRAVAFPLYLRIPAWCKDAAVSINGKPQKVAAKGADYIRIDRTWNAKDTVSLRLPFAVTVQRWPGNHDAASVNYGPLTFSLKIKELNERVDSTKAAIGDSQWQKDADPGKWPSTIIRPGSAWNYALVLDEADPAKSFTVETRAWPKDDFPFTAAAAPIVIKAKGRRVPSWQLDQFQLVAPLQDSPVKTDEPVETIDLIPMGAARLRITAFPVAGRGPDAHVWKAPQRPQPPRYRASASFVFDKLEALSDAMSPGSSADETVPRFTWWDHRGTTEWVQYDFAAPRKVSGVSVYWFDDSGHGECRVPQSWRVLYRNGDAWKPVSASAYGTARDAFNSVSFATVTTDALRLEVKLQPGKSGGILEWQIVD